MKKLIMILLAMVLLLSLTACDVQDEQNADLVITRAPEEENVETSSAENEEAAGDHGVFAFVADGVELIPGEPFDPEVLGEAASVYEVPSCAIEGTDNVYNYELFELTAYDDGTGEVIYSIYLMDAGLTTAEGLALGDDVAKVIELYGENYTEMGTAYVYARSNTQLIIILQNDVVISIEYRLADI